MVFITFILLGIILDLVSVFWGLEYYLIPFLSITRSTFGKISYDYPLKLILVIT
jgi:hypothetical protein